MVRTAKKIVTVRTIVHVILKQGHAFVRGVGKEIIVIILATLVFTVLNAKNNARKDHMETKLVITSLANTSADLGTLDSHANIHVHWEAMEEIAWKSVLARTEQIVIMLQEIVNAYQVGKDKIVLHHVQ